VDAHHDQVARRRAELAGSAPRLYFAYSTILDRAAFDEWREQHGYADFALPAGRVAEALDVELVYDFPSRWWGGRVAGLSDRPGARVWGVVYEVAGADWPVLEHKEGAITGMTVARPVRLRVDGAAELTASAFTTRPERARLDGPVSTRFVAALVRGAAAAGLPAEYVERLRAGGAG
jgi:gamma-glutamylcyclotransferase